METLIDSATSESNTGEDWDLIIQICERVSANDSTCREVANALMKRLQHKNVNVVLFTLTLTNSLVQNCQLAMQEEICSRPFLQTLVKLLNPKTHITVKNRILELIQTWANDFKGKPTLDYMSEVYNELKAQGNQFNFAPPSPIRKGPSAKEREEEELQLALAMSLSAQEQAPKLSKKASNVLFKVRALYDFNPTESGELGLKRGEVVDVYDNTTFPDWWKGSNGGQVGIFPANYVERVSGVEASGSAEDEDEIAQIERNMGMVREFRTAIDRADPLGHSFSENQKLQESHQKVVNLVPQILKVATAKRNEQDHLAQLHERFLNASGIYQSLLQSRSGMPTYPPSTNYGSFAAPDGYPTSYAPQLSQPNMQGQQGPRPY